MGCLSEARFRETVQWLLPVPPQKKESSGRYLLNRRPYVNRVLGEIGLCLSASFLAALSPLLAPESDRPRHAVTLTPRWTRQEAHLYLSDLSRSPSASLRAWRPSSAYRPWSSHFIKPSFGRRSGQGGGSDVGERDQRASGEVKGAGPASQGAGRSPRGDQ